MNDKSYLEKIKTCREIIVKTVLDEKDYGSSLDIEWELLQLAEMCVSKSKELLFMRQHSRDLLKKI